MNITDALADRLSNELEENPYGLAGITYISVCALALNIALFGKRLADIFAQSWTVPAYTQPPLVESGYLAGLLCGAVIVYIPHLLLRSEALTESLAYLEARIATQQYPKHGDNE